MSENQFWYLRYLDAKERWSRDEFINYQRLLIMQAKVKHPLNAEEFPTQGELFTMPSLTLPDQSMSVREIMRRYAQGLPLDGAKVPLYEGEEEMRRDISRMDLSEIEDELREITGRLQEQKAQAAREKEQKMLADKLAEMKILEELKAREQASKEAAKP